MIRSYTEIYPSTLIGKDFETGHFVLIRELNLIGNNVSIGSYTEIAHHVTIGNNVKIHSHCFIPEYTIIEDNVWIGPRCTICNDKYPNQYEGVEKCLKPVYIEEGAVIGANVTILPDVRIGKNSFIGAGSVVCGDVLPNTKVGNKIEMRFL